MDFMPHFVPIARTVDIPPGARDVFEIDGLYIAIFNVGGAYYAIEDVCTHDDGRSRKATCTVTRSAPRHGAPLMPWQSAAYARRD
jgi:3-phenylpropionate/trans-cinnamate dioxygenase ferredoxin subunit